MENTSLKQKFVEFSGKFRMAIVVGALLVAGCCCNIFWHHNTMAWIFAGISGVVAFLPFALVKAFEGDENKWYKRICLAILCFAIVLLTVTIWGKDTWSNFWFLILGLVIYSIISAIILLIDFDFYFDIIASFFVLVFVVFIIAGVISLAIENHNNEKKLKSEVNYRTVKEIYREYHNGETCYVIITEKNEEIWVYTKIFPQVRNVRCGSKVSFVFDDFRKPKTKEPEHFELVN